MATQSSYSVDDDGCPYEREAVTAVPDAKARVMERCASCGAAPGEPCNPFCIGLAGLEVWP